MVDEESIARLDEKLRKYFIRILQPGNRFYCRDNSILILGCIGDGQVIPNFYASAWRVLKDNDRISRVFTGKVAVYFIQEDRVEQMPPEKVCNYVAEDMDKKLEEKRLMQDLSDELDSSDD